MQAFLVKAYDSMPHVGLMFLGAAIMICGGIMLTTLVPMGSLHDPEPRVQLIAGLAGLTVSGGSLAHFMTQSAAPVPPLMWLMIVFLLGLPVLAVAWGVKHLISSR